MPFVHFVYYDIQLTKMNKQVTKEKKLGSQWKPINQGYHNGEICYVWVQIKRQRTYKQILLALEAHSWLGIFMFS